VPRGTLEPAVRRVLSRAALAVMISGCDSDLATEPTVDHALTAGLALARSRSRQIFPLDAPLINSCYNGGAGESIQLSGFVVVTFQTVETPSGAVISHVHVGTRGVHGVGLTSGIRYQALEHENDISRTSKDGSQHVQFLLVLRTIAPGPGNNELLTSRFHLVIAPDGSFRYTFNKTDHVCR
jgi:hypothetical protein